ncbi:hypothetical protein HHK36_016564 [Tetracentron sinense]|uniref:Cupin type-1 domain-containing protein n=1 Tax=Tetracentron sinense TaxID=13715 RepID=A0A834YXH2_TETSI|nr:hypothetical protein HHK36_016564 [Tetracentron sinense]
MAIRKRKETLVVLLVMLFWVSGAIGYEGEGGEEEGRGGGGGGEIFVLHHSKPVLKTDAGEMRVVKGYKGRGEAKIGWIYKEDMVEKQLKMGDVYRIPAGSAFYMVNTGEGQRLQIICSITTSESLGMGQGPFQSFFVGGGKYPKSVLAGFEPRTLTSAFNVSVSELNEIMTRQQSGPIVFVTGADQPSRWEKFMQLKLRERLGELKNMEEEDEAEEEEQSTWTWRKLLNSMFKEEENGKKKTVKQPDSYNVYDRKPDFKNNYGWSIALDESDYTPLSHSGIGVFLVNLTAGSMMAPHVNPTATEYGIVLRGSGSIQVVFPNGTSAMNAEVEEGDVFWVPRYFPFCQIASRKGPMEFFGFTTSARKNRPQFLVGASSVLQSMRGPELATAFGASEEMFGHFIDAQRESIILPSAEAAPPKKMEDDGVSLLIESVGSDMIMV